ncbi:unnamed protein product [Closterium sp. NIES-64]|nr:unnamed protein product [Closterium sp. NIES-64]
MRKRERENPCYICGHYHKYEEGEPCGVCGHRLIPADERSNGAAAQAHSAFSSEIIPGFLFCGSYDNASRSELLKAQGITRILNTVPTCQNLYKNSFVYHTVQDSKVIPFEECNQFIEQCEREQAKVLVHCMSGQSRSPAVVVGYLMRAKGVQMMHAVNNTPCHSSPNPFLPTTLFPPCCRSPAVVVGYLMRAKGVASSGGGIPDARQGGQTDRGSRMGDGETTISQHTAGAACEFSFGSSYVFPANTTASPSSFPPLPNFPFPMPPFPLGPDANPADADAAPPFAGMPPLAPVPFPPIPGMPAGGMPFAFPGMGAGAGGNPPEGFVFGAGGEANRGGAGQGGNGGGVQFPEIRNDDRDHAHYLDPQNRARAEVGSPAIVWDAELQAQAERLAEYLAQKEGCAVRRMKEVSGGVNLRWAAESWGVPAEAESAVAEWVREKAHYRLEAFPAGCAEGRDCTHYTQVVWKKTERVGCGTAMCNEGGAVWACRYFPPGNIEGDRPY